MEVTVDEKNGSPVRGAGSAPELKLQRFPHDIPSRAKAKLLFSFGGTDQNRVRILDYQSSWRETNRTELFRFSSSVKCTKYGSAGFWSVFRT